MAELALVADIGGTNTRVALARAAQVDAETVRRFANADHDGIAHVLTRYLTETSTSPDQITGVCVAAAGPVHDGVAQMTNLGWQVDRDILGKVLTADRVAVLNDLQAQGHAIGSIAPENLIEVIPQPPVGPNAAKLVVGVGTGFNAAPVYDTAAGRFVPPSECGHVSLPDFGGPGLDRVIADMRLRHEVATVEEALSGRGVAQVHRALHGVEAKASDIIAAVSEGDRQAETTVRLLVQLLGTFIGDLALIHLPFGGISLIGGVSRNLGPWLIPFGFVEAMRAKGRFGPFMDQFGVNIITDDYAALTGCASHLSHQL